ncbi:efflux RND transporter periplasmic adaptor subunit, partial [Candidatus Omnitrophota bacterium]
MTTHLLCLPVRVQSYFLLFLMLILSCGGENQTTKEIPAQIENPVEETMLSTITLTESAEQRLGIETAVAELKNLPGIIKSGGEVIAVPGQEAVVTAPISGTIFYAEKNVSISAGMVVKKGQDIMRLLVMPSENDLFLAREDIGVKETAYRVMLDKYTRSEQLLEDKAISEKVFQAVEVELANVQAALKSAKARLQVLDGSWNSTKGNLATLSIQSPIDGVLHEISAASGQRVTMSTPLFVVSGQNPVWIRVTVYVGDVQKIDMNHPAILHPLGDTVPGEMISVSPVQGPPLSDPVSASSELFF